MTLRSLPHRAALLFGLIAALTACGPQPEKVAAPTPSASAPGRAASGPPVGVVTIRAQQRDMPVLISATGTVAPLSSVEVRPQTTNLVAQVHVNEGQFVKARQLLFTLDSRVDEANVARAIAQLARDDAALADAQRQFKRSQELLAQYFISQGALDSNQTAVQSQTAAVAASRAALDTARLSLSYTRITAPSAGRLGAINVFPGSSVQANQTTLASITQLDPIAVAFSLPQQHLADALAALKDGGAVVTVTPPGGAAAPVGREARAAGARREGRAEGGTEARGEGRVLAPQSGGNSADNNADKRPDKAADKSAAPAQEKANKRESNRTAEPASPNSETLSGRLRFVDNAVDATSGTVKAKAQFDNKDNRLWPGAFVKVAMTARVISGAVVVPQAAIVQNARGTLVYVVQDGLAQARPVQVLYAEGEDAAVSGLKPGDRVVLDGRQNVRPGSSVVENPREGGKGGGKGSGKGGEKGAGAQASAPSASASGAAEGSAKGLTP